MAHWAFGLGKAIRDSKNIIISTEYAVVIADKYPKAKHHFLILPTKNIPSIYDLTRKDLPLLSEMQLLAQNVIELQRANLDEYKVGFHAEPSMVHLHLHVISKDFVSDCLKTRKHWNSFNTALFIPFEILYEQISTDGAVRPLTKDERTTLIKTELRCNQCSQEAANMTALKTHLLTHFSEISTPST